MESILICVFMAIVCISEGIGTAVMRRHRQRDEELQGLLNDANEALEKLNAWSVEYEVDQNIKTAAMESKLEKLERDLKELEAFSEAVWDAAGGADHARCKEL